MYQTHKISQETKIVNKPEVIIYFRSEKGLLNDSGTYYTQTYLCVQNVGGKVAQKVGFVGDTTFDRINNILSLNSIIYLKNGIDVIGPGQIIADRLIYSVADLQTFVGKIHLKIKTQESKSV